MERRARTEEKERKQVVKNIIDFSEVQRLVDYCEPRDRSIQGVLECWRR